MVGRMYDDKREIKKIYFDDESCLGISENEGGFEKIVPYNETGEMVPIVWFAVFRDGKISQRINSKYVCSVIYT